MRNFLRDEEKQTKKEKQHSLHSHFLFEINCFGVSFSSREQLAYARRWAFANVRSLEWIEVIQIVLLNELAMCITIHSDHFKRKMKFLEMHLSFGRAAKWHSRIWSAIHNCGFHTFKLSMWKWWDLDPSNVKWVCELHACFPIWHCQIHFKEH